MERFILTLSFILMIVFLTEQSGKSEYNDYKTPFGGDSAPKNEPKIYYPPKKKKPYTRNTWKV